jgi:hypothetical protein
LLDTSSIGEGDVEALDEVVAQRDRLLVRLRVQRQHGAALWSWYHGRQTPPAVIRRYADQYRLLLDIASTPWARLVVDTIAERLHVTGFRRRWRRGPTRRLADFPSLGDERRRVAVYTGSLITGSATSPREDGTIALGRPLR